jgi:formylglycine-generating enzyme required for sulfatase activity
MTRDQGDDVALGLKTALAAAWRRSDQLFSTLAPGAWLDRPIGLRLPFLFYLGHLPAFAWNQIGRGALAAQPMDETFERVFERGIDPENLPENLTSAHRGAGDSWPTCAEIVAYRDRVRLAVAERIDDVLARTDDELCEHGRVIHLVIEHELMHQETLLYMMAECPDGAIIADMADMAGLRANVVADSRDGGDGRAAEPRHVPAGMAMLGAHWKSSRFGWDNEFGRSDIYVPQFEIDSLPVRNRDWLAFWQHSGQLAALRPLPWRGQGSRLSIKTVFGAVPFDHAAGWPVQVSCEQAAQYCQWRGGRLPTEAELHRAAYHGPDGATRPYPWGHAVPEAEHGNFGFRNWQPLPVGRAVAGASAFGVEELVGNGWEWTSTVFAPLPGFRPWARTYPGYSADFFDGQHNVVFGASWATDDLLLRPSFRNWYRRNYPYPFTSFRIAQDVS